ncbi:ABC transporter ATP-binding protein [Actinospica durhamensis]|nr:ATP-binding cassette domain-containing protein [Actinospica durhamensis]
MESAGASKRYGRIQALDRVSLRVPAGRVTGLLGPNGAGKSTLLRLALGLDRPDAGWVRIAGRAFTEQPAPARVAGALLDGVGAHPAQSGLAYLRTLALAGRIPAERVAALLEEVGLAQAARRSVGGYSLGMRQRLGIAAALLGRPRLLILDEPTNGLDPEGIAWVHRLLREHTAAGGTAVLSSHHLAEAEASVDHVVLIKDGRVLLDGPKDELAREHGVGSLSELYLAAAAGSGAQR